MMSKIPHLEELGGRVKRDAIGRPMLYSPFIDEAVSISNNLLFSLTGITN